MKYFLRWDQDYGLSIFMAKGGSCTTESLNEVTRLKRWSEVEPAFIRRLNDRELWRARDAAEVLGQWGDAKQNEPCCSACGPFTIRGSLGPANFANDLTPHKM